MNESTNKIRIALIGCGRISHSHHSAIQDHNDKFEIVAFCDIDPEALKTFAAGHPNATLYTDFDTCLRESGADVVALCTPSGLHAPQAIAAAKAGKHVISEKPMATTWEDGKAMVKACEDAGVKLFVVKQNRANATIQCLRQAIDKGRFGRIFTIAVNVFWTRPQAYYDSAEWRGTWAMDGGALMNQASHYIDLLHWLFGPIDKIQATTATLARDIEVEDTAALNIRWQSGALGSLTVSMLTYPKNYEGSITVIGEKGTVKIGGVALNEIQHWEFAQNAPEDDDIRKANYATDSVYGYGHSRYYHNVAEVLLGRGEAETDGYSGLKALELLIAAYTAAKEDRTVALPLEL